MTVIAVVDLSGLDSYLYKCITKKQFYDIPFWESLITLSGAMTIFFALLSPKLQQIRDKEALVSRMQNSLKNEILWNLVELTNNVLSNRYLTLEIIQLSNLLKEPWLINIKADGILNNVKHFYNLANQFNQNIGKMNSENKYDWSKLKTDAIELYLMVFVICEEMSYEELQDSMIAIKSYLSNSPINSELFEKLKKDLPDRFWKLNDMSLKQVMESNDNLMIYEDQKRNDWAPEDEKIRRRTLNFLISELMRLRNIKVERMDAALIKNIKLLARL